MGVAPSALKVAVDRVVDRLGGRGRDLREVEHAGAGLDVERAVAVGIEAGDLVAGRDHVIQVHRAAEGVLPRRQRRLDVGSAPTGRGLFGREPAVGGR
jgi:hypothetical protein